MKSETINELSGFELREAIAKEVMGLDIYPSKSQLDEYEKASRDYAAAWNIYGSELGCGPKFPTGPDSHKMARYELDITAAFEVVAKVTEKTGRLLHVKQGYMGDESKWAAGFYCGLDSNPLPNRGTGATAPEAICRAALITIKSMPVLS